MDFFSKFVLSPLRLARLSAGQTQYELARKTEISASRLSLLERGIEAPAAWEIEALADALGVPEATLFPSPVLP